MKKSEWSDNELEQLLRRMPKVKDHRDPRDIYQSLSIKAKKRKRPVWIIPSVASVAAVLLILLLTPNMWQSLFNDSNKNQEINIAIDNEMKNSKAMPGASQDKASSETNHKAGLTTLINESKETAIYDEDIIEKEVLTYWVPDKNAQILVPVSVLVPKESKSWLSLFVAYSTKLNEEQWGLSEYYPLNATLSVTNDDTINVDVPENHLYGAGSANETSFQTLLVNNFLGDGRFHKVTLSTDGKPGINFGNYGELTELSQTVSKSRAYFLYNPNNQNLPFLVPSNEEYKDIESALESMKHGNDIYGLKPSLPSNLILNVNELSKENLVITFKENPPITNDANSIYIIEAILLTAKEFGYQTVKFENCPINQIGRFNLQNEIKVPIAPNKVSIQ